MGQTLTHGVYLPSEGERNCYSGLASNWRLLDGAIGTVAAHTTAIAGKASSSHTHGNISNDGKVGTDANKPLITGTGGAVQAGSFGTAANTFCEGNDSRLSDARTPVAHTHTKSDVTDLFNSANTWGESNTFSKECNIYNSDNSGSVAAIKLRNSKAEVTSSGNVSSTQAISFVDKNNFTCTRVMCGVYSAAVVNRLFAATKDTNGNSVETELQIVSSPNGTKVIFPTSDADVNLGNSAHRWKTLNGINPGALSLPDIYDSYDVVTTNWSTAYNQPNDLKINGADPSYPGWLFIRLDNCTAADDFVIVRYFHVNATNLTFFGSFIPTASSYVLSVPIQAGITTKVWVSKIPTTCKYYACLGTVK